MKLLSPADFIYKNGRFYYMDRPMSANSVNVKSKLTINCPDQGGRRVVLTEGVYSLDELKTKVISTK
jgi:hypothetical protein